MATTLVYTVSPYVPFTKILSANANQDKTDIQNRINWAGGTSATTGLGDDNIQSIAASGGGLTRATKLKAGTANHVLINSGTGAMSSEATLALSRGGLGVDFNAITKVANDVITWNGSSFTSTAATPVPAPTGILNIGITTSVAANAMTIALKDRSLSDPTANSPVTINFRNATSATGDYTLRTVTSALSVVVPSGATLGHTSAVNQYIYLWALDNAGTVELAVSGSRDFDDGSVQSSTTIGGSSTSHTVLYSTTGRTSKPIRLLARILSNQTTAGTYASNSTEISHATQNPWPTSTPWKFDLTFTPTNFGVIQNPEYFYRRVNDTMEVRLSWVNGTSASLPADVTLPTGHSLDPTKISTSGRSIVGEAVSATSVTAAAIRTGILYTAAGVSTTKIFSSNEGANNVLIAEDADTLSPTDWTTMMSFSIPIKEWRSY